MATKTKKRKKLTKAERRVEVAKDALEQIRIEALLPQSGAYFNFGYEQDDVIAKAKKGEDAKGFIIENVTPAQPCGVCAKGALLISLVRKENKHCLRDLADSTKMEERLEDLFEQEQLTHIENAFEGSMISTPDVSDAELEELEERYETFCESFASEEERLVAILKNIVKNKGTFKLPK